MTTPTFEELGLAEPLLRALAANDYTSPTPIQARAIPALLEGRDLLGLAQTGTGKTAAFSLPLLHRLAAEPHEKRMPRSVRALILAPTRELAIQIGESLQTYGKFLHLSHTVIFGGVSQARQVKHLSRGVDILVATPGRLLDLLDQKHVYLNLVTELVLDEADRMLDMGFVRDVKKILALIPKKRHALLFSATMPSSISALAAEILKDPVRVEVTPEVVTVDKIDQRVLYVDGKKKRDLLAKLLEDDAMSRVIVFTRTKHGANRVSEQLEKSGIPSDAIHGNKSQGARQRALEAFRSGDARVLVATDIAARGIDVTGITHVVNYELPNEPESYVHRIGRTARAGTTGIAISFCDSSERGFLRDIERLIKRQITVVDAVGYIGEGAFNLGADVAEPRRQGRGGSGKPGGGAKSGKRPQGAQGRGKPAGARGAKTGEPRGKDPRRGNAEKPWSNRSAAR
ncbi:MAG: DEAD/DEAH box helicase [Rhizobiales bacterium]|nr:DEAD/DEAH box helicase [Hyphomicrobiales bacterium]